MWQSGALIDRVMVGRWWESSTTLYRINSPSSESQAPTEPEGKGGLAVWAIEDWCQTQYVPDRKASPCSMQVELRGNPSPPLRDWAWVECKS